MREQRDCDDLNKPSIMPERHRLAGQKKRHREREREARCEGEIVVGQPAAFRRGEERRVSPTGQSRHRNKQSRSQSGRVQARLLWFDQRESSPMDLSLSERACSAAIFGCPIRARVDQNQMVHCGQNSSDAISV